MNNAGSCWQITFAAQETTPPLLEEFLEEYFEVVACDYNDDGQEIPIGYTSKDFDSRDFKKQAAARGIELPEEVRDEVILIVEERRQEPQTKPAT